MIGPEGTDNCHKFVDILGLRTIFPLFMKSPRKIKKVGTTEKEHEGRVHWETGPNLGALGEMAEMRATLKNSDPCLRLLLPYAEECSLSPALLFSVRGKQPGGPGSLTACVALALCLLESWWLHFFLAC